MERVVGAITTVLVIAAVAVGLTVFNGWDTFLDVTGLSEFAPKPVYTAMDEQCDQAQSAYPDDLVRCSSPREYLRAVARECADEGSGAELDTYLFGVPGTTRTIHPRCPEPGGNVAQELLDQSGAAG